MGTLTGTLTLRQPGQRGAAMQAPAPGAPTQRQQVQQHQQQPQQQQPRHQSPAPPAPTAPAPPAQYGAPEPTGRQDVSEQGVLTRRLRRHLNFGAEHE